MTVQKAFYVLGTICATIGVLWMGPFGGSNESTTDARSEALAARVSSAAKADAPSRALTAPSEGIGQPRTPPQARPPGDTPTTESDTAQGLLSAGRTHVTYETDDVRSSTSFESRQRELTSLLDLLRRTATLDDGAIDQLADAEAKFVRQLDESPELVDDLLKAYVELPSKDERRLLRSLLAATESIDAEVHAMDEIKAGDTASTSAWFDLLRDLGVKSSATRGDLLAELPSLTDAGDLRSAILAIAPHVVPPEERMSVLDALEPYSEHADVQVRSAAVETLSRWGDQDHAHVIEQALLDGSVEVRQAALFAAFSSNIRSDTIKSSLLGIMNDADEDWDLRMEAHSALLSYPLQGEEYDDAYEFHLERELVNGEGAEG